MRFGPFQADLRTHELWRDGIRLKVSGQPFQVLEILLERPGQLVDRDELRARIWHDDTFVDFSHGLNAAVNKLREALSDSAQDPRYIETLPRRGYRFIAPVEYHPAEKTPSSSPANPTARPVSSARAILVAAIVLVLIGAALAWRFLLRSPRAEAHETAAQAQRIRPLTTLTDSSGGLSFSPNGAYVAFFRDAVRTADSGIFVTDVASNRLVRITANDRDCCPAWSPDGRSIAFTRRAESHVGIYVVTFDQSQPDPLAVPRKIDTGTAEPIEGTVAWSADGESIAFSSAVGINLVALKGGDLTRLTLAPPNAEDWGPSFSTDGKRMLFVRSAGPGTPDQVMLISRQGGEPMPIISEAGRVHGAPQWSVDERSIIYSSTRTGQSSLWRVSLDKRDAPVQINDNGWQPSLARQNNRLVYERLANSLNVWKLDLASAQMPPEVLVASTSQTDQGPGPQFSPDGRKLAFMSDRSGTMEIWVADSDGSNPYRVSSVGNAGTPRWSPDSRSLAFDAPGRNTAVIYTVNIDGSSPRILTPDLKQFSGQCPSWSQDGKWIYFASNAGGSRQLWKIPSAGGTPAQVTKFGGNAGYESFDGKYVYYAKTFYANPEIWRIPVRGGPEEPVSPGVRPASWASWQVVDNGIVFASSSGIKGPEVSFFDFTTRRITRVASLPIVPFWLTATRDGKTIAFDRPGWQQAQAMLVENFR
ncbi:MAG TPA: winged helix-turn-helix domain-containing protein [Terriglobales bacterium]